jgi:hypothetical protein
MGRDERERERDTDRQSVRQVNQEVEKGERHGKGERK